MFQSTIVADHIAVGSPPSALLLQSTVVAVDAVSGPLVFLAYDSKNGRIVYAKFSLYQRH